jgi:NAD(P)-dependent dehydrogenase (short-subunit alcohol dehydrogenase family)
VSGAGDRWALVTGGSRGIGGAVAVDLARRGWNVGIVYLRNEDAAQSVARSIRDAGGRCEMYCANLAKPDECTEVVQRFVGDAGSIGGLVHAAGLGALSPALATRPARWQLAWDTHVGALISLASAAQTHFANHASIVAFSSLGSLHVMPGYASIAAAKGALEALVKYLAAELTGHGVTVNAIRGGPIDTDSLRSFATFAEVEAESKRRAPGRLGRPEDLAPIVAFLLSPEARWINGQVITADGGFSLG